MAAHKEQGQRVVEVRGWLVGGGCQPFLGQGALGDDVLPPVASLLAAEQVGQPTRGDSDHPAPRILWDAVLRPLRGSRDEGLLHSVLGDVKVPIAPDDGAEDLGRQLPQQASTSVSGMRGFRTPAQLGTRRSAGHPPSERALLAGKGRPRGGWRLRSLGRSSRTHDPVAGEDLPGFGVGPVRDWRCRGLPGGS